MTIAELLESFPDDFSPGYLYERLERHGITIKRGIKRIMTDLDYSYYGGRWHKRGVK